MTDLNPLAFWQRLRTSLWAVPAAIVIAATGAAVVLVELHDRVPASMLGRWPALFGAGAEGSRAMLTAIAGSMITVAGVAFSITLVTLSLASTQYSPRVLRNFLGDRANQTVLGVFVGIFAYCLIVLRTIRDPDEGAFVPGLAVLFGIVLAFVGIGFLIFFIHHVATTIQASSIMERIADETIRCLERQDLVGDDESRSVEPDGRGADDWHTASAPRRGFVASIDYARLDEIAEKHDAHVRIERGVGEFAIERQPLVSITGDARPDAGLLHALAAAFEISRQRTAELDPAFGIRQLVDVTLKALSSGGNDPTTASIALDYLTAILVRVTEQGAGTGDHDGGNRYPRVQRRGPAYADLLRMSLGEIRQTACGNLAALEAIGRCIDTLERVATVPAQRQVLLAHAEALLDEIDRAGMPDCDGLALRTRVVQRIASLSAGSMRPVAGSRRAIS